MRDDDPRAGTIGNHGPDGIEGVDGSPAPAPVKPPEPKRRGRPRCSDEPTEALSVRLPVTVQDRIIHLATQRKQPVSEYLRDVMIQLFMRGH